MDLVDEENRVLVLLDLFHHLLEALLEVAAIARAGEQRPHVEREHRGALEHLGHIGIDDLAGEALGNRGLADARVADQQRIVLLPPAKDLDRALDLRFAADQRIDAPLAGLAVEIDAIGIQGAFLLLGFSAVFRILGLARLGLFVGASRQAGAVRMAGALGDAVADVIDRVVAGHVLFLQEEGGVGLAFGKDRHQNVRSGHLLAPGRLHVEGRALHDALEAVGRLRLLLAVHHQVLEFRIEVVDDGLAQHLEIDAAGSHHRGRIGVVDQGEQQVFEGRVFVMALVGERKRLPEGLLERAGEYRHEASFTSFP